ncbi:hypothetical protein TWF718_001999 [Orbilia javanica]|uniref:Uncharacterized protein n=1 Tax=Orbilia javanica TaxID=47235 RepID=A0AAN8RSZ1_9PEZI
MRLRYLTTLCLLQRALGMDYFTSIRDLANEPTLATGDTSEYRIPIDGQKFGAWERVMDYNGLIDAFLKFYRKGEKEWERIFYGRPGYDSYNYNDRSSCFTEKVDKLMESILDTYMEAHNGSNPPMWFRNMIVTWANTLFEVVMSTRENPFYDVGVVAAEDVPEQFSYKVAMFNRDFPEDFRDALKFEDFPVSRMTADHLHLFFTPLFRGRGDPNVKPGSRVKPRSEQVGRYLLNGVEISGRAGENMQTHEFQFVVSDIDVSLGRDLVTVFVDPNKTTRMRETLLKLRDRLFRIMTEGLRQAWDIRTEMGFLDSKIAGVNRTMEEREQVAEERAKAAEAKKRAKDFAKVGFNLGQESGAGEGQSVNILPKKKPTPLFSKWQVIKDLIVDLSYMPEYLIKDLDAMAEVLRVMEVPQLPDTEESIKMLKDLTFNPVETPNYMRLSNIETMESPISQNTEPGGPSQPLQMQNVQEATFREGLTGPVPQKTDRTDRAFEDLISAIPVSISLDLRDSEVDSESQQQVQLMREGSDPFNGEHLKLLSTDVSPSARSLLHPGYSPSQRNHSPPRRSIFSGTGSRFSDVINDAGKNQ